MCIYFSYEYLYYVAIVLQHDDLIYGLPVSQIAATGWSQAAPLNFVKYSESADY